LGYCKDSFITGIEHHHRIPCKELDKPTNIRAANRVDSLRKVIQEMRPTLLKFDTSRLTANEEALLRCQTALELKDKGEYFSAQEVMRPFWKGIGERPETERLSRGVAAEVLLCAGILTAWIGSKNQVRYAPEAAKDLITQSLTIYESLNDGLKVATARAEIAYCYWHEGALGEARIWFNDALQKLTTEGNTRALALLRLAIVEWSALRYDEAKKILIGNRRLFERISNHAIKGGYHHQLAMLLRTQAVSENRDDYFQDAIREYEEADQHFRLAQNSLFRANVKNNLGNLLRNLSRFTEAHKYLDEARRLTVRIKDKVETAQIDDTRARVFIDEGRLAEAESVARRAVSVLEKSGQQCLLADTLITHGIALARLSNQTPELAHFTLQRAIEVAYQVGAYNKAGLAALTLIEELADGLASEVVVAAYDQANRWLAELQESQEMQLRLNAAARKVLAKNPLSLKPGESVFTPCNLRDEVLKFEGALISRALAATNGRVTRAAALLSTTHQNLASTINRRHPELLQLRSPVRPRGRRPIEVSRKAARTRRANKRRRKRNTAT
jgi:tetratricopeptide (TPR) repeat protein